MEKHLHSRSGLRRMFLTGWLFQDSSEEDELDGYGSDLIGDEEDRARLAALNELEREMILAERSEARDRKRERRDLLKQRQREAADQVTSSMSQHAHAVTSLQWHLSTQPLCRRASTESCTVQYVSVLPASCMSCAGKYYAQSWS